MQSPPIDPENRDNTNSGSSNATHGWKPRMKRLTIPMNQGTRFVLTQKIHFSPVMMMIKLIKADRVRLDTQGL